MCNVVHFQTNVFSNIDNNTNLLTANNLSKQTPEGIDSNNTTSMEADHTDQ